MNKKNMLAAAMVALLAFPAVSEIDLVGEKTELMVVKLTDGTTSRIPVDSVEYVSFTTGWPSAREFAIVEADGSETSCRTVDRLYRVVPEADGAPIQFGFGTASGSTAPAALVADGEWGLTMTVSGSLLYTSGIDLAANQSVILKLMKYADGGSAEEYTAVSTGTLSTSLDRKNRKVSVAIEAQFVDGPEIKAEFTLLPDDVESLADMTPGMVYANEVFYYGTDGRLVSNVEIAKVTKSGSDPVQFTFTYTDGSYVVGSADARIYLGKSTFESMTPGSYTECNLAEGADMRMTFGTIQLAAYPEGNPRHMYSYIVDNGTFGYGMNADGTYRFFIDVVNSYTMDMGSGPNPGGSPERIVLHYNGPVD